MKILLVLLLIFPLFSFAEDEAAGFLSKKDQQSASPPESSDLNLARKFNIKTNLLGLALGVGDISFEYKIKPHITVSGALIYGSFTQNSNDDAFEFNVVTMGGNIKANYYFNEAYTNGFYVNALAGYLNFDVDLKGLSIDAGAEFSSPYLGASAGYVHFYKQFNFGLGAGYSYSFEDDEAKINIGNAEGTASVQVHLKLLLEATIGFVF